MEFQILILTRDAQLYMLIRHVLATEGFAVSLVGSADEAVEALVDDSMRAVMIDSSATKISGDAFRTLKTAQRKIALILLSNRTSEDADQAIEGSGADFIIEQPFDPARLIRFLRRLRLDGLLEENWTGDPDQLLRLTDLEMNMATVRVRRNGHEVPLTALEFRLLRHLMQNPATVQSREQLIVAAWPPDAEVEPRTVDIHVGHIRRALKMFGPDLIRTVRSHGYALDPSAGVED